MSAAQYQLEIYEPDDSTTAVGSWPSTAPLHVAVGDLLHLSALVPNEPPRRVRAVAIEHALWLRNGVLVHKLMVFTEPE